MPNERIARMRPLVTVRALLSLERVVRLGLVRRHQFADRVLSLRGSPGLASLSSVKLAALLGLYVGWLATSGLTAVVLVLYAMLVGFLVGSVVGIVLFAFRGRPPYPFGPFLIGGAIVVIAFSTQLL